MNDEETRLCRTCNVVKPLSEIEYRRRPHGDHVPTHHCKACKRTKRQEAYREVGGKDQPYAVVLMRDYGITLGQYAEMSERQDGLCAVCRRPETKLRNGVPFRLSVDHDHATGAVRDLLCSRCNYLVGIAEASGDVLEALFAYLARHRTDGPSVTQVPVAEREDLLWRVVAEVRSRTRASSG